MSCSTIYNIMDPDLLTIEKNSIYGRYLVSSKNIKEGELILKESPILIGSQIEAFHICFKCCKSLKVSVKICRKCKVATLCTHECQGMYHKDSECDALKSSGLKAIDLINNPQVMMPLRCLLLRNYDQKLWSEFLMLESHLDKRRNTLIWDSYKEFIEEPLRNLNVINQNDLDEELVQKICGILDVNTFEVRCPETDGTIMDSGDCLRGLYLGASLMTHDCIGNTLLSVDDDFVMTVCAAREIREGETIFFNYGNCLKGTRERRHHLRQGKYFECDCRRCSDPSELGTHMSSIRCNKCKNGLVVPTVPLSDIYKTLWSCQNCAAVYEGALIQTTVNQIKDKMASLDLANIPEMEELLKKSEMSLSPQHYLILELKQNMIPTYEQNLFSDWAMRRKIQLCIDVINVLKVIEPGISRLQGIALYQLHSTQVNLANKLYQCKEITPSKYLESLLEAEENLATAVKYLVYEPKNSPEGRLTQHALNDLKILRNTIKQMKITCDPKLTEGDIVHDLICQKKRVN